MRSQIVSALIGLSGLLLFSSEAMALTCPAYPYPSFSNGSTADATQVTGDFTSIMNCANTYLAPLASPSFTGSVGIGTASPLQVLDVNGSINVTPSTNSMGVIGDYLGNHYFSLTRQSNSLSITAYDGIGLATGGTGGPSTSYALFANSSGNIGIGTTSPLQRVEIDAPTSGTVDALYGGFSAMFQTTTTGGYAGIQFGGENAGTIPFRAAEYATSAGSYRSTLNFQAMADPFGTSTTDFAFINEDPSSSTLSTLLSIRYTGDATLAGCLVYNGGTSGTCISDDRVKKNIASYTSVGLQQVLALKPVTYQYNGLGGTTADGVTRNGFVAEQVRAVAPSLVTFASRRLHPTDKSLTPLLEVNYGALDFALVNAVKELNNKVDASVLSIATGAESAIFDAQDKEGVAGFPDGALADVMKLRPVTFRWQNQTGTGTQGQQIGFVAQDVKALIPDAVMAVPNNRNAWGMNYAALIPVLTKAIQEQQAQISDMKVANDNATSEIRQLKTQVSALQRKFGIQTAEK